MKNKKGSTLFFFVLILVLFAVIYTASRDVMPRTEVIKKDIELKFNK